MDNAGVAIGAVILLVAIAFALFYINGNKASAPTTTVPSTSSVAMTSVVTTTSTVPTTTINATTTTIMPVTAVSTTFTENGLPLGSRFVVIYDGMIENTTLSSYSASLTFSTQAGNYPYTILNYSDKNFNFTYVPGPYSGNLTAGSSQSVSFTKEASRNTAPSTTTTSSSTSTTTIPANQTSSSNPNCVSPDTVYIGGHKAKCYAFTIELTYLGPSYSNSPSSASFKITYYNMDGSTSTVTSQGIIYPGHSTTFYKAGHTLSIYVNQTNLATYTGGGSASIAMNYT